MFKNPANMCADHTATTNAVSIKIEKISHDPADNLQADTYASMGHVDRIYSRTELNKPVGK